MIEPFLPVELKLKIVEYLDPISTFHFAITCKEYFYLFQSIIEEHARLFAENRCIHVTNWARLRTKLKEILDKPQVGWYVRELILPGHQDDPHIWDRSIASRANRWPETDRALFYDAAERLDRIYPPQSGDLPPWNLFNEFGYQDFGETIDDAIMRETNEAIFTILVHHLPWLKVLRVSDGMIQPFENYNCFGPLMHRIAVEYGDPLRAKSMPFQRLESVAIAHDDSEGGCMSDWALFFNSIPSVRSLVALNMSGQNNGDIEEHVYPMSNVKELLLLASQINIASLECILKRIKGLERFTYHGGGPLVAYDEYEPKKVIRTLAKHHGHSLEHLNLETDEMADLVRSNVPSPL